MGFCRAIREWPVRRLRSMETRCYVLDWGRTFNFFICILSIRQREIAASVCAIPRLPNSPPSIKRVVELIAVRRDRLWRRTLGYYRWCRTRELEVQSRHGFPRIHVAGFDHVCLAGFTKPRSYRVLLICSARRDHDNHTAPTSTIPIQHHLLLFLLYLFICVTGL